MFHVYGFVPSLLFSQAIFEMPTLNKQVIFSKVPTDYPVAGEHICVQDSSIDLDAPLEEGQFLIKLLALSVDPYMRNRMRDASSQGYTSEFILNEPMTGDTMNVVLKSNNIKYKEGDLVHGKTACGIFAQYAVISKEMEPMYEVENGPKSTGLPITNYLGALAITGLTGYVGLLKYGAPKKGETLYVSAAAGAIGQLVGQIGKVLGLRVVGSAGSDIKTKFLVEELGFDAAFNYKTAHTYTEKLKELCPNGIDIYFDNVGGKMLEAAINNFNNHGRIIGCGMISQYNGQEPEHVDNLIMIISKRLRFEGFVVFESLDMFESFRNDVTKWLLEGKIKYHETIFDGIELTPQALVDMLRGKSIGKQLVKVADF
ncbi:hypothetical protein BDB00DRAFT_221315 [Zychaea mexicana]|uniref:uncharacterized protein n=1 Tax=Zychaea mexicana TaxID=64656 RepID=UPI0022FEC78F|nr:uncharacterized protein BDB00DRAFT_221315 [Zychaea mexicana]KAI9499162.1 hypothetical protein BDB00DRAFT_221315 [Zychaea mexicana]